MKEIITALEAEIVWCKEHQDDSISKDYRDGFIKGLEQGIIFANKA